MFDLHSDSRGRKLKKLFISWRDWVAARGGLPSYLYRAIVLLALIQVALAAGGTSRPVHPLPEIQIEHHRETGSPHATDTREDGTEFWPSIYGYRLKITDTLIVILTLGLLLATWFLYLATRALVRGADITAQHQLRAYLVAEPNFIYSFDPDVLLGAKFQIRNVGVTPAHNVRFRATIAVAASPLTSDMAMPAFADEMSAPITIFPAAFFQVELRTNNRVSAPTIEKIRRRESQLLLLGEIRYFDEFRKSERLTNFCVFIQADDENLAKLASNYGPSDLAITFASAPVGNDCT